MKIEAEINLDWLKDQIANAKEITGDEEYFEQLSSIEVVKKQVNDILDQVKSLEAEAKGLINEKAKMLYGNDWQVISGKHVKITRSQTGAVYSITGTPGAKFVEIKKTVNSKAVDQFVAEHNRLPKGIDINPSRGEQLRVTIK